MTAAILIGLYGAVISLIFEYVPFIAGWYDGLTPQLKQSFMAVFMLVLAVGAYVGQCQLGWFSVNFDCTIGWYGVLGLWLSALTGNQILHQGTHLIFKKSE